MKTRKIILPALAVILVIGLAVGTAIAYFTAHTEASGSEKVNLGFETIIEEKVESTQKTVTIRNSGPESVWVRVTAFSAYDLDYSKTKGWTKSDDDGYWYYDKILAAGESTTDNLIVGISRPAEETQIDDFNVIVLYECTPVQYDENGNPDPATAMAAKWDLKADTTKGGE